MVIVNDQGANTSTYEEINTFKGVESNQVDAAYG